MYRYLSIAAATMIIAACSTVSQTPTTWLNPDIKDKTYNNALIIGIAKSDSDRRLLEDKLASAINKPTKATASYNSLEKINQDEVTQIVKSKQHDMIIVAQLINTSPQNNATRQNYLTSEYKKIPYYSYYAKSYNVLDKDTQNHTTAKLETNIYDAQSNQLIWSERSDMFNTESTEETVNSIIASVAKKLKTDGIVINE